MDFRTYLKNYPSKDGMFGRFGGAYLPPELAPAMQEIMTVGGICRIRQRSDMLRGHPDQGVIIIIAVKWHPMIQCEHHRKHADQNQQSLKRAIFVLQRISLLPVFLPLAAGSRDCRIVPFVRCVHPPNKQDAACSLQTRGQDIRR